jgi:hypothetical protein
MATKTTTAKTTATKAAAKKVLAKKVVAKKTTKRAALAKKAVVREPLGLSPIKAKLTRADLVARLSEECNVPPKQIRLILATLGDTMKACMMPRGCGEFQVPGLLTVKAKKIPARKGGKTVISFGKETVTKDRPATVRVRARALGGLKRAALGTL